MALELKKQQEDINVSWKRKYQWQFSYCKIRALEEITTEDSFSFKSLIILDYLIIFFF